MRQKQSSKIAIILSIIIELLLAFGAILGNFASDALKVFVRPYLPYSFFIFVTMTLVGIGLTFWKHRLEAKSESSIPIVNNDGEATHSHAGVQGGRGIIGSLGSPDQRSRLGALQLALAVIVLPLV